MQNVGSSLFISLAIVLLERSHTSNSSRMLEFINPFNGILKGPALVRITLRSVGKPQRSATSTRSTCSL